MDFIKFKHAVAKQFEEMQKGKMFRTDVDKDTMWGTYLGAFPEGSNPMYRVRTEHDCSCCRQFIRAVGNVVSVTDGILQSIWDIEIAEEPEYQTVANSLARLVKSSTITNEFLHTEKTAGTDKNFEELMDGIKKWEHFFVNIPKQYVCAGVDIGTKLSVSRSTHDVMLRSLTELTLDSVNTVLELIAQNSLYRGEENQYALKEFKELKKQFDKLETSTEKDMFVWERVSQTSGSIARIRNTAIGTLLEDISNGVDIEKAVTSFEKVVAPENYKRPTAIVTKAMVEKAKAQIESLGLTSALQRRYANAADMNINDILYVDRETRKVMEPNVFDEISESLTDKKPKNLDRVQEVSIETFLNEILPTAKSLEIMAENNHVKNLMSIIAPVDPTAGRMFKWDNNFSWAYKGDVADSIKERIKKAGGNVEGDLCCRLAWNNYDDLDIHMQEPMGGHICYSSKRSMITGGQLDIDMNAGGGTSREPVENIFYRDKKNMIEGVYELIVNQFCKRENIDIGFDVEVDFMGKIWNFHCDQSLPSKSSVCVMKFKYTHANGIEVLQSLPESNTSKSVWGIKTNTFQKVNMVMLSPNHWEDAKGVGNKHYFFIMDKCNNPDEARGFFNEYIREEFTEYRKVFEIVGSKMRAEHTVDQLSGLGFSSTRKESVLCRVTGSFTRIIKIVF